MPPCGQCNSGTAETASVLYLTHPVLSRPFLRFLKIFPADLGGAADHGTGGIDKPNSARCAPTAPCGFLKNCPGHRREAIDKAPEMGYSKDTKGLPVGRFPPSTTKRSNCELGSLGSYFFFTYDQKALQPGRSKRQGTNRTE